MPGRSATALQVKGGTYSGVFRASLSRSFKENFDFAVFCLENLTKFTDWNKQLAEKQCWEVEADMGTFLALICDL